MTAAEVDGRSARKRQDIVEAATTLFLLNGYRGTSMDEIAAAARVSKQTVYKNFADKESLFRAIVAGVAANSDRIVAELTETFGRSPIRTRENLEAALVAVARHYLDAVLEPRVLSLRRLIIAEAERFPDLARAYYDRGPARGIEAIATALRPCVQSGLLKAADLKLAAAHFAHLAVSVAQDRALFAPADLPTARERGRLSGEAARAFLRAYQAQ